MGIEISATNNEADAPPPPPDWEEQNAVVLDSDLPEQGEG